MTVHVYIDKMLNIIMEEIEVLIDYWLIMVYIDIIISGIYICISSYFHELEYNYVIIKPLTNDSRDMGDPIRIGKHWAAQTNPQALSMILNFTSS